MSAAYSYQRIVDLVDRIRDCADVVEDALPSWTPEGNLRARNYAAQVEVDVRELRQELLERHLAILREVGSPSEDTE
jgi:hypothetical protein